MGLRIKHAPALLIVAAAGSQAGHLLAYAVRFGSSAQNLQSAGAHGYFPLTAQLAGGAAGLAALLSLLAIGAARLTGRGQRVTRRPLMEVLPLLFLLQMAVFAGQETLETAAAGSAAPDAVALLLWGALGQLPAAVAGALALSWLLARTEAAVEALRRPAPRLRLRRLPARVPRPLTPLDLGLAGQSTLTAPFRRGPPTLLPA